MVRILIEDLLDGAFLFSLSALVLFSNLSSALNQCLESLEFAGCIRPAEYVEEMRLQIILQHIGPKDFLLVRFKQIEGQKTENFQQPYQKHSEDDSKDLQCSIVLCEAEDRHEGAFETQKTWS